MSSNSKKSKSRKKLVGLVLVISLLASHLNRICMAETQSYLDTIDVVVTSSYADEIIGYNGFKNNKIGVNLIDG